MDDGAFKPGERVVALGVVAVSSAVSAGLAAGAWTGWLLRQGSTESLLGAVAGAALGYGLGRLVAHEMYSTEDGRVSVVRVGAQSLPATLKAGLMGGLLAAVATGVAAFLIPGAMAQAIPILAATVACGAGIGAAFACMSSLL